MQEPDRVDRYARQVILPFLGVEGQRKLIESKVVLVGCGALGTGIANNLARAGVGHLKICDRDFVELNNLQRQTLFDQDDVEQNMPKAAAAAARLARINSEIDVEAAVVDVNFTNIESLVEGADLVIDGVDNFQTRYLINDVCVKNDIPWIYGGCVGTDGVVMPVDPHRSPCLRCAFPVPAPTGYAQTCDTAGVLNAASLLVACLQSAEAIKFLSGNQSAWIDGMLKVDMWFNDYAVLKTFRDDSCVCCVQGKYEFLEGEEAMQLTSLCGRNAVQIIQRGSELLSLSDMADRLSNLGRVTVNKFLLKFGIQDFVITLFPDGRAIVHGTDDLTTAKNLYAKYIGN